jgi:hypothetical protein
LANQIIQGTREQFKTREYLADLLSWLGSDTVLIRMANQPMANQPMLEIRAENIIFHTYSNTLFNINLEAWYGRAVQRNLDCGVTVTQDFL